jgi:hypothetical protein
VSVLLGNGHPDVWPAGNSDMHGVAPLPGTDQSRRLMCGPGAGFNYQDPGKLLVKKEWDVAEAWLVMRPNGDI